MSRTFTTIAVAVVLIAGGAFHVSPYWALDQLASAAREGDADRLAEYVDFPAVRESLKAQVTAKMMQPDGHGAKADGFQLLAGALASKVTDTLIDSLVTPEGIARLISNSKDQAAPVARSLGPSGPAPGVVRGYTGVNTFEINSENADGEKMIIRFKRENLFFWKLKSIRVPL